MKKVVMLSVVLLIVCTNRMLNAMDNGGCKKLTFVPAEKGEDLSEYKEILNGVYLQLINPDCGEEEDMARVFEEKFTIVTRWIGEDGKRFIKALDDEKPVGFMTLEALNDDETHIAFHQSPLLPEYAAAGYQQFFGLVKREFPNAKKVSTACTPELPKLQAMIEKFGFERDDSYNVNPELMEGITEIVGYTKALDEEVDYESSDGEEQEEAKIRERCRCCSIQ